MNTNMNMTLVVHVYFYIGLFLLGSLKPAEIAQIEVSESCGYSDWISIRHIHVLHHNRLMTAQIGTCNVCT